MIAYIILIIFSVLLITATILYFIKNQIFINSKSRIVRKIPFILAISMGGFIFFTTLYFNHKRDDKIGQFDLLKLQALTLDTSLNKNVILSAPVDIFSSKRIDTLKSLNEKLYNIKNYLSAKNIFSTVTPEIQDSVNATYACINNKKKLLERTDINHGYIYGGICGNDKWIDDNFQNLTHTGRCPIVGDRLICIKPIFVRSGEAHKVEDKKGWVNQQLLGILQVDRKIIVKEIIKLPNDYFWIRF